MDQNLTINRSFESFYYSHTKKILILILVSYFILGIIVSFKGKIALLSIIGLLGVIPCIGGYLFLAIVLSMKNLKLWLSLKIPIIIYLVIFSILLFISTGGYWILFWPLWLPIV